MREWHKPTVEETESGMEVTSYLLAELDPRLIRFCSSSEIETAIPAHARVAVSVRGPRNGLTP